MALNVNDTQLKLLYALDESGPTATRVNLGYLGSAQDLSVYQSTGIDGVPSVDDGNVGKAARMVRVLTGWTTATRWLRTATVTDAAGLTAAGYDPGIPSSAATMYAFGARFKWGAANTGGGGIERENIFGVISPAGGNAIWALNLLPNHATTPTLAAIAIRNIWASNEPNQILGTDSATYTITGSPAAYYIQPNLWYRVIFRCYWVSATNISYKLYVYEESTGTTYTFTKTTAFAGPTESSKTGSDWGVYISSSSTDASNRWCHDTNVDECWYYKGEHTEAMLTETLYGGISSPWVEPNYTYNDHDVRFTHANETSDFPVPRALPLGCSSIRVPMPAWGTRLRTKLYNFRPSRPMALRQASVRFDTQGPRASKPDYEQAMGPVAQGLIRQTGALPSGALIDVSDIDLSGIAMRRRRGFRVRRDVDNDLTNGYNAFATFRNYDDVLYQCYKAGTTLYAETGSSATALDTGWSAADQPVFAILDGRLLIMTRNNQKIWDGDPTSIDDIGCETPTGGSVAATAGTLTGTYGYAYTFYDPVSGDESTPKEVGSVTLAAQGALLSSLDNTPAASRFTQQRIYRTAAGGTTYYLIDTQNLATTYTDNGVADGTVEVGYRDDGDTFITSTAPDTFAGVTIHMERAFYFLGTNNPEKIWPSEPNEPCRWDPSGSIECEGPIMAAIGQGSRLIVFTRHTTELLESDWVRDADGNRQVRRTVLSRRVGCVGPNAVCDAHGQIYWIDQRGIYTLMGDQVVPVTQAIAPLFPAINMGIARFFVARYNQIRQQVWFCVAMADLQTDNSKMNTQIVLHLGEQPRWSIYHLNAAWCGEFDDDLNGLRFGVIDQFGVFKELESYEGDGIDDPSDLSLCEGTISSIDTTRTTVTVTGSPGWTTDALRGYGVVFLDNSTGLTYYRTIVANGAATMTFVEPLPASLIATDNYYVGGIDCYAEFAEHHFGSTNLKTARTWYGEFDDLTTGRWR